MGLAGWTPDRRVSVKPELLLRLSEQGLPNHPAVNILANLGDLHLGETGQGEACTRSDLAFQWLIDCETSDEVETLRVSAWQDLLRTRLVGIASVHHVHADLLMASDGRCFGMSLIHDAFWLEGLNLDEALVRLLVGQRCRPMLRPDQREVSMWGEHFTTDHPLVYDYQDQ